MPKVSVYLPDDLAAEVRRRGLPLSALAQAAVHDAIHAQDRAAWVTRMRTRPRTDTPDLDLSTVMAAVRDELGE